MKYAEIRQSIAVKIRQLREAQGLNQRELAQKAGVSQKTISNLENTNAASDTCNLDKLTAVATALKTTLSYLLENENNKNQLIKFREMNPLDELDEETIEFAKAWQNLSHEQRSTLTAFVHACQKPNKKTAHKVA